MLTCKNCDHNNYPMMLICVKCGVLLNADTSPLSADAINTIAEKPNFGTVLLDPEFRLVLHIGQTSILMRFPHHSALTLGRGRNTVTDTIIEPEKSEHLSNKDKPIVLDQTPISLDLEPFGGMAAGVSRKHTQIENGGDVLSVTDLGSTNGTRLNGTKLRPGEKRILRDNDVLALGLLKVRVVFHKDELDMESDLNLPFKAEAQQVSVSLHDAKETLHVRPEALKELEAAANAEPKTEVQPAKPFDPAPPTLPVRPEELKGLNIPLETPK